MIINDKRALAYTTRCGKISPIPNADNIDLMAVNGWKVIIKKGEFKEGDLCVFFEIDSKLPQCEWSEFMSKKHYKVKSMKLNKFNVISQGLALPLDVFGLDMPQEENVDVTDLLCVTYAVEEDNKRKANVNKYEKMRQRHMKLFKKNKLVKWLYQRKWGKQLLFIFLGKKRDKSETAFPTHFPFVHKTDEERIENMPWILEDKSEWIKTLKIDGTSSTYILERKKSFWKDKFEFYVLSRNVRQLTPEQKCFHTDNVYWNMAYKYDIEEFLKGFMIYLEGIYGHQIDYVAIQGETAGQGVQGNPHGLDDTYFYGFNLIDSEKGRWGSEEAALYCSKFGILWCPILDNHYILPDTMEEIKEDADGLCDLPHSTGLREGFVYRNRENPNQSFKNVSREFLIKKGE